MRFIQNYLFEIILNVGCFYEFILKKGHTKCMSLIGYFCFIFSASAFHFFVTDG